MDQHTIYSVGKPFSGLKNDKLEGFGAMMRQTIKVGSVRRNKNLKSL
jgi:hypothetical protein